MASDFRNSRSAFTAVMAALPLLGAVIQPPASAFAQTNEFVAPSADQVLSRAIRLSEIGLADGARLSGLGASRDFYFPVPKAMKYGATLNLAYETATSFDSQRSIEIFAGERSLLLKPLNNQHERQTLRIPLDSVVSFLSQRLLGA